MESQYVERAPLLVLNASAGSGKTYRLVYEYLLLILHPSSGPGKYKQIMAMTFTNKAAMEMKERIIEALKQLSQSRADEKSDSLLMQLSAAFKDNPIHVSARAKHALTEILHGYEEFNVSTIDKFNLRIIRSFSRDLNLPQDFEIIMDEKELLDTVIDIVLSNVGDPNNQELTHLVEKYAENNLEEGISWNFKRALLEFCTILSKERYRDTVAQLIQREFKESEYREAKSKQKKLLETLKILGKDFFKAFDALNVNPESLPQKNTAYKSFLSLNEIENWPIKNLLHGNVMKIIDHGYEPFLTPEVHEKLQKVVSFYLAHDEEYYQLKNFRASFFNTALLRHIAIALENARNTLQFIRISEFNTMISQLIREQQVPYVYEKLGNRLHHFLLDEFQDTSRMQWLNLVPLIEESLSKQKQNLIVGDPKQSIYRFNNGVAEQFVALPGIYNPEQNPEMERKSLFFKEQGELQELVNNYRSGFEIVGFNNRFFQDLKTKIPERGVAFYKSTDQVAQCDFPGYVSIKSYPEDDSGIDLSEIKAAVKECLEDGYLPSDICILTEKRAEGNSIARYLLEEGYKVVSADSLLIHTDNRIRLCISYFKLRNQPGNRVELKRFAELYIRLHFDDAYQRYFALFEENSKGYRHFSENTFFDTYFSSKKAFFFTYENFFDLIQQFYALMDWNEIEDSYLHCFADLCYTFQMGRSQDITDFLSYYDRNKEKLAIQFPETKDAIQIMTIHKSKGLQFPIVLLPNANFNTTRSVGDFLIPDGDYVYYNKLSSSSKVTGIQAFSNQEKELMLIDKINLLYVALTRPINRLYVWNPYKKGDFGATNHLLLAKQLGESSIEEASLEVCLGNKEKNNVEGTPLPHYYYATDVSDRLWYPDLVIKDHDQSSKTEVGKKIHALLAECDDASALKERLMQLKESGLFDQETLHLMEETVLGVFNHPTYRGWIEKAKNIKNEASILCPDGEIYRPDKIIELEGSTLLIDFKTGTQDKSHITQLRNYQKILLAMGYEQVSAYLYYTQTRTWSELE